MAQSRTKDPLATWNERVKLFSGFLNAVGLGLIGFAVLRPLTAGETAAMPYAAIWGGTGLAMHVAAHYVLGKLRKDPSDDSL